MHRYDLKGFEEVSKFNHNDKTALLYQIEKKSHFDSVSVISALAEIFEDDYITPLETETSTDVQDRSTIVLLFDLTGTALTLNEFYNLKTTISFNDGSSLIRKSKVRLI